jgi:hypothetical protein
MAETYRQAWRMTARKWLKREGIPNGFRLVLVRSDGRQVRDDLVIHRRTLPSASGGGSTVRSALDGLKHRMLTNLDARGFQLKLLNLRGERVPSHTLMISVRAMPGLPTDEERARASALERDVGEVEHDAEAELPSFERFLDDPEVVVPRGVLRALIERYGRDSVRQAIAAEGIT